MFDIKERPIWSLHPSYWVIFLSVFCWSRNYFNNLDFDTVYVETKDAKNVQAMTKRCAQIDFNVYNAILQTECQNISRFVKNVTQSSIKAKPTPGSDSSLLYEEKVMQ